jgi:hypothetical protein
MGHPVIRLLIIFEVCHGIDFRHGIISIRVVNKKIKIAFRYHSSGMIERRIEEPSLTMHVFFQPLSDYTPKSLFCVEPTDASSPPETLRPWGAC